MNPPVFESNHRPMRRLSLSDIPDFTINRIARKKTPNRNPSFVGTSPQVKPQHERARVNHGDIAPSPVPDNLFEADFENFKGNGWNNITSGMQIAVIDPVRTKLDDSLSENFENDLVAAATPPPRQHSDQTPRSKSSSRRKRRSRHKSLDSTGIPGYYRNLNDRVMKDHSLQEKLMSNESMHSSCPSIDTNLALPSSSQSHRHRTAETDSASEEDTAMHRRRSPKQTSKRDIKTEGNLSARLGGSNSSLLYALEPVEDFKSKHKKEKRASVASRHQGKPPTRRRSGKVHNSSSTSRSRPRTTSNRHRSLSQSRSQRHRRTLSTDKNDRERSKPLRRPMKEHSSSSSSFDRENARLKAGSKHKAEHRRRRRNSVGHDMLKQAVAAVDDYSSESDADGTPRKPYSPMDDKVDPKELRRASRILVGRNRRTSAAPMAA